MITDLERWRRATRWLPALLAAALLAPAQAADETWPDESAPVIEVNEGELRFFDAPLENGVLHARTELEIDADSARSGWVGMRQCYRNLDTISKTEISYAYRELSGLRVTRSENIGRIEAGGQSLLLENVEANAALCVAARVRILRRLDNGNWRLRNGPYHRRFFDGYYPYHVSLGLHYAGSGLEPVTIDPPAQPGFSVETSADGVEIDAWFEGILQITVEFASKRD